MADRAGNEDRDRHSNEDRDWHSNEDRDRHSNDEHRDKTVRLRGAESAVVAAARRVRDPLPGTCGFAGLLAGEFVDGGDYSATSGLLVRDVLGREPLFVDSSAVDPTRTAAWSFDPTTLQDPRSVAAGSVVDSDGSRIVWTLPSPDPVSAAEGQETLNMSLEAVVSALDSDGLAVAFSGGVDSGVVAAGVPDAPCYVTGFEGCHDIAAARAAATRMDCDLRVVTLTHDDVTRAIVEIVAATGRQNPMDLNIAVPLYLTAEAAATDGFDRLAVGQGADELFGGYSKVVDPATDHRVAATTVRGARDETLCTLPTQLERDVLTIRAVGVEPVAPLLDDRIVRAALQLPGSLLVNSTERKVAFRRAASPYVPESVRNAEKKAVQYGTYVAREIDRLARQNGFKRRMDDHVEQYVQWLCAERTEGATDGKPETRP